MLSGFTLCMSPTTVWLSPTTVWLSTSPGLSTPSEAVWAASRLSPEVRELRENLDLELFRDEKC